MNNAVESVLAQPYQQIKIILVDDGSTDGSAALCDALAIVSSRIYVIHKENGGVSSARNAGIEYVLNSMYKEIKDGYIAFLDADDEWTPDFFSKDTVDKLQLGYELIGYRAYWCNENLTRGWKKSYIFSSGEYFGADLQKIVYWEVFCSMLYSFSLLRKYALRFRVGLCYEEDELFRDQCLYLSSNLLLVDKVLYLYRDNISSAIHKKPHGLPLYVPVFRAFAEGEVFLNEQAVANKKGITNMGKGHIGWSVPRMIEDHFRGGGRKQEIEKWISENGEYIGFLYSYGGENAVRRYEYILKNMTLVRIRCRLFALLVGLFNKVKKIKTVRWLYERKKYPILLSNVEK